VFTAMDDHTYSILQGLVAVLGILAGAASVAIGMWAGHKWGRGKDS
jgi:hypothetical protein